MEPGVPKGGILFKTLKKQGKEIEALKLICNQQQDWKEKVDKLLKNMFGENVLLTDATDINAKEESVATPLASAGHSNSSKNDAEVKTVKSVKIEDSKDVKPIKLETDDDAACEVCGGKEAEENNEIIFCDKCNLAVHQACYCTPIIPEGRWYCRPCEAGLHPGEVKCRICTHSGGGFLRVVSPATDAFAHVHCVWWVPRVAIETSKGSKNYGNVINFSKIDPDRRKLLCSVCNEKGGTPIQCQVKNCKVAFHPFCGKKAKLQMDMNDPGEGKELEFKAYCSKHSR